MAQQRGDRPPRTIRQAHPDLLQDPLEHPHALVDVAAAEELKARPAPQVEGPVRIHPLGRGPLGGAEERLCRLRATTGADQRVAQGREDHRPSSPFDLAEHRRPIELHGAIKGERQRGPLGRRHGEGRRALELTSGRVVDREGVDVDQLLLRVGLGEAAVEGDLALRLEIAEHRRPHPLVGGLQAFPVGADEVLPAELRDRGPPPLAQLRGPQGEAAEHRLAGDHQHLEERPRRPLEVDQARPQERGQRAACVEVDAPRRAVAEDPQDPAELDDVERQGLRLAGERDGLGLAPRPGEIAPRQLLRGRLREATEDQLATLEVGPRSQALAEELHAGSVAGADRLVTVAGEEQQRRRRGGGEERGQERRRVPVSPVEIVDAQDERPLAGERPEQLAERREAPLTQLVGVELGVPLLLATALDRPDPAEHREEPSQGLDRARQEVAEARARELAAAELSPEDVDHRVDRLVGHGLALVATTAQDQRSARAAARGQAGEKVVEERRLADPRRAVDRDDDGGPVAAARGRPSERVELDITADEPHLG